LRSSETTVFTIVFEPSGEGTCRTVLGLGNLSHETMNLPTIKAAITEMPIQIITASDIDNMARNYSAIRKYYISRKILHYDKL
jgi:hypothetical protein